MTLVRWSPGLRCAAWATLAGLFGCGGAAPLVQADAGPDAQVLDAGNADAGAPDGGATDAGLSDAGGVDAGVADSGLVDAGSPGDGIPAGAVSFFRAARCPPTWNLFDAGIGRTLVPVSSSATSGAQVSAPLADREDRPHNHPVAGTVIPGVTSFAAAGGGANTGVAAASPAAFTAQSADASSDLPYLQLLMCQKASAPDPRAPLPPRGMLLFFPSGCPAGWTEFAAAAGRLVVGVPDGGLAGAAFGGPPLGDREIRAHVHTVDSGVALPAQGLAAASGCCATGYAAAGTAVDTGAADASSAAFPYVQLVGCSAN